VWLAWLLVVVLALAAGVLAVLWQQARRAAQEAELALAHAERSLREVERASQRAADQLLALQQAQIDPALLVAADRTVVGLNPAARALFGPQAELGQSLILSTRSVELDELVAHCLQGGGDCDRQVRLGRNNVPYRARAVPAGDPGRGEGQQGAAVSLQDLSEVQRLGRARRDFVANISHELRTPITSVRLLVDTLRGTAPIDREARDQLLEKISVEIEALSQLAQELLDLAQIESGQILVRMVPVRVAEMVASVTERLGPLAARKRQTVRVDVPPDLQAWADSAMLTRALGNLVHNAIKFTPEAGEIWVAARLADGEVLVEVGDTGPGIPPDDLPRVFERFFRGDPARASGGTGLGLAIAKHVVEAHGGRLSVESEGRPGRGAVFRLALPAASVTQAAGGA
jgi:two-component system phosphate regulon sensor histidine kinase PhoR